MDVQIIGLSNPKTFPENPTMFTELTVTDTLVVPETKPPIEHLMSVSVEPIIHSTRIIRTPSGRSRDGLSLRGAKVVVEGIIKQTILYVADASNQPVHGFEGILPFSASIVVPSVIDGAPITGLLPLLQVTPFVEDVYVRLLSPRSVFKNVVLFLNVAITPAFEVPLKNHCRDHRDP